MEEPRCRTRAFKYCRVFLVVCNSGDTAEWSTTQDITCLYGDLETNKKHFAEPALLVLVDSTEITTVVGGILYLGFPLNMTRAVQPTKVRICGVRCALLRVSNLRHMRLLFCTVAAYCTAADKGYTSAPQSGNAGRGNAFRGYCPALYPVQFINPVCETRAQCMSQLIRRELRQCYPRPMWKPVQRATDRVYCTATKAMLSVPQERFSLNADHYSFRYQLLETLLCPTKVMPRGVRKTSAHSAKAVQEYTVSVEL